MLDMAMHASVWLLLVCTHLFYVHAVVSMCTSCVHVHAPGFGFQLSIFDDYEYAMLIDPMLACTQAATWERDRIQEMQEQHMHYGAWRKPHVMQAGVDGLMAATLKFVDTFSTCHAHA